MTLWIFSGFVLRSNISLMVLIICIISYQAFWRSVNFVDLFLKELILCCIDFLDFHFHFHWFLLLFYYFLPLSLLWISSTLLFPGGGLNDFFETSAFKCCTCLKIPLTVPHKFWFVIFSILFSVYLNFFLQTPFWPLDYLKFFYSVSQCLEIILLSFCC